MTKKILIALGCLSLAGCMPHFKEMDSYGTNFQDSYSKPDSVKPMPEAGDPYTFSGIAGGSGGTIARQSYATDTNSTDFRDATASGVVGEFDKSHEPTRDPASAKPLPGAGPQVTGQVGTSTGTGEPAPSKLSGLGYRPLDNPTYSLPKHTETNGIPGPHAETSSGGWRTVQ